ncbi:MAG: DUF4112 domain-containing protein [Alphaproteobacteria bacterium]|nr:DUF4112 domain-containing protein [Alphaproteobacteria bacterium]
MDASPIPRSRRAGAAPETDALHDIRRLARALDAQFTLPGTGLRFGYDSLLGLIPAVGDVVSGALGLYIIARAHRLGASPWVLARMGVNLGVDTVLGAIPIVGDVFDFAFKANLKNAEILIHRVERRARRAER